MIGRGERISNERIFMEWVSVKERLPVDGKSVLIFYDGHMSIGSYISGTWFGIGDTFPEVASVTHWMKPEPPKRSE